MPLAQDVPEARSEDQETLGRATEAGGGPRTIGAGDGCWSACLSLHCPTGKRPKKGLATAKQRLGRILKIHRNGKLLL